MLSVVTLAFRCLSVTHCFAAVNVLSMVSDLLLALIDLFFVNTP